MLWGAIVSGSRRDSVVIIPGSHEVIRGNVRLAKPIAEIMDDIN